MTFGDRITLKALKVEGKHGYYPEEREKGNRFEIDLIAVGSFRKAISEDDLSKTFDYEKAEKTILKVMNGPSEKLIEKLCAKIGDQLFDQFQQISLLTVSVRKLNPPINTPSDYAEIKMLWKR